jgi:hypothetical protein
LSEVVVKALDAETAARAVALAQSAERAERTAIVEEIEGRLWRALPSESTILW